ncbi:hypothetical protein, partial [Frankia sp. CIT1]|uniref:nSTAND1 domain-containing NTPase n=1 Tax=Frankia sp. CIT1 TaxID=2880974 RepID=UPI00351CEDBF
MRQHRLPPAGPRRPDPRTGDGPQAPSASPVCPYRGLEAYGVDDARFFFGREQLTATLFDRLTDRIGDPGVLVVVGASGAGKSSLLRAGLLAGLPAGRLPVAGSWAWPTVLLTPGPDPLTALASGLA